MPSTRESAVRGAATIGYVALGVVLGTFLARGFEAPATAREVIVVEHTGSAPREVPPFEGMGPPAVLPATARAADAGLPVAPAALAEPEPPMPPREAEAEGEAYGDARRAVLDELVARSPRAPGLEAAVRSELSGYVPRAGDERPEVVTAECSREICRIELRHTTHGAGHRMLRRLATGPGLGGAGFVTERPSGDGFVTRIYVGQDGFEPPRPDWAGEAD